MTIKRLADENKFDYIKRLTYGKRDGSLDLDYSEWSFLAFGQEYSSDVARRMFYGVEKILKAYEEEKVMNVTEQSILEEIATKQKELAILKVQFQDQRREYNKYLKAHARWEHLIDTMREAIRSLEPFRPINVDILREIKETDVQASLLLSDWHLYLETDNYWNTYNIDIARLRIEHLKRKVLEYVKRHNVQVLHVEVLGDMINGAIHVSTRIESEEDVMTQAMQCSEIVAEFIYDLAKQIPCIKVHCASGNHGRVSPNKKESIETENFERMIPWFLKERFRNIENVEICDNKFDNNICHYQVNGMNIFSAHGHLDKVGSVISDYAQMFKVPVDEVHLGHFHSYYEKEEHGSSVVVNGTLSGTDTYAKNIRKVGKPMQVLRIYDTDVCTYKIEL